MNICCIKISVSGQNGQFRTPRHIIEMMVQMVEPRSNDVICDPACGSGDFVACEGRTHVR